MCGPPFGEDVQMRASFILRLLSYSVYICVEPLGSAQAST